MKCLCIGYFDPARMQALSPDAVDTVMRECPAHMEVLHATEKVTVEAGADNEARFLHRIGGKLAVSDHGLEGQPKIGCVYVLEVADMDEAVRVASLHPTTQIDAGEHLGWYTEIRPIHYFYDDKGESPKPPAGPDSLARPHS